MNYRDKTLLVLIIILSMMISQLTFVSGSNAKLVNNNKLKNLSNNSKSYDGYIVKLKKSVPLKGFSIKNVDKKDSLVKVSKEKADQLKKERKIIFKEPNYIRKLTVTPNDPYFINQYALERISAPSGWEIEKGTSRSVIVAVIDTGVDINHPDLSSSIVQGYDFVNNDLNPSDDQGHGTHVAGIIAARANNNKGISGVSWGAKIMPVKVIDSNGFGSDFNVANGIRYAVDHGAKVINLSLGGPGYSSTLEDATDYAYSKGAVVFAAAGNDGDGTVDYPAADNNVISVAATDQNDNRAWFSNYNSTVDISAPGVSILSTYYDGSHTYAYMSGTSMATPYAAGLAAVLLSSNPSLSSNSLEDLIKSSSDDLGAAGKDNYYGYGRINLYRALSDKASFLSAKAPSKVKVGKRIVIKGSLKPGLGGQRIIVKMKKLGSRSWSSPRYLKTNTKGLFNYTDKPRSSVQYSFRFIGTDNISSSSKRVKVLVKPKVGLRPKGKTIKRGSSLVVSGFVYPRSKGKVRIYIYKSGKRYAKNVRLRRSKFKIRLHFSRRGVYRLRALVRDRNLARNYSRMIKVRVK